jgi:SNF family Na+-dependent transporter
MSQKQEWGSRIGVILAVSGSAVGLGNFLRFPGNAAQNGGGAFMIPYFIALLLLGIPIGWAEWTMGRHGGRKGFNSAPAIMGVWGKGSIARFMGSFGVLIPLVVYFYYVMIESWCLRYAYQYATGGIGVDSTADVATQVAGSQGFFADATGLAENGLFMDQSVLFWVITSVINVILIYRGLSKGIEAFCRWAMPGMAICALIVLVRVLTLGTPDPAVPEQSVAAGLNFMWNPDFAALKDFRTWLAAAGQIFFSLSVGFGVIINYSSYMKRKDDVVLSGLTASATNEFFEVALGGMITLTASVVFLGAVATEANTGGTFSTGFTALPVVFARMPLGNLFGAIWFFMLFLAAITSSLSMLQPAKAFFQEALGLSMRGATTVVMLVCLGGNLFVLWFSKGLTALDTLDFWVGTFMIFVVAGTQIICFGWVFGVDKGLELAHQGAQFKIPRIYRFIIKYVSPTFLLVIFVGFLVFSAPDYVRTVLGDSGARTVSMKTEAVGGPFIQSVRTAVADGDDEEALPVLVQIAAGAPDEDREPVVVSSRDWSAIVDWSKGRPGWSEDAAASPLTWEPAPIPPDKMALAAWGVILAVIAMLMVVTAIGARRWRRLGLDLDGEYPDETHADALRRAEAQGGAQ